MPKDLISVIMPVKNAALFLTECLNSILVQDYTHWELIAVDDASLDNSWSILQHYAKIHPNISCVRNNGVGIIAALKTAYSLSKGTYISRMDADDRMPVDKLKCLYQALSKKGKGFVSTGLVQYFSAQTLGNGYRAYAAWLNGLTRQQTNFSELYKECVIPSPCWMIHRDDLNRCGAFDIAQYPEDYDLCFRWYKHRIKCIGIPKILHHWRDSAHRASRTDPNYADNNFLQLKVGYFLALHRTKERPLIVWGAGKKGKKLAYLLKQSGHKFEWICNNPKKIGHYIHAVLLGSTQRLAQINNPQIIVVVAQKEAQQQIKNQLERQGMQPMQDYFFFC